MYMTFRASLVLTILAVVAATTAPAATNLVKITEVASKYYFAPSNIVIRQMDTILWSNTVARAHDSTHNATPRLWASGSVPAGGYSFTFTNVGYYPYYCLQHISLGHPEQTGIVSVVSLTLTNPANGNIYGANTPMTIAASASTNVASVQFMANGSDLGTDTSAPFAVGVNGFGFGNYTVAMKVTDSRGYTNTFTGGTFFVENITISEVASYNGSVTFNVHGGSFGQRCIIYASTDLSNPLGWVAVSTNVFPNTLCPTCPFVTFQDSNAAGNPRRFFKAQVIP
jgi:plastocyanin